MRFSNSFWKLLILQRYPGAQKVIKKIKVEIKFFEKKKKNRGHFRPGTGRVPFWAIARPLVVVRGLVRPMRPLATLRLLWHRARPTLAHLPAPRGCLPSARSATVAAHCAKSDGSAV